MLTDDAIRERKTEKILATSDLPTRDLRETVTEILTLAGQAPFHRACEDQHRVGTLTGIEPWRFHVLDAAACRRLHPQLPKENAGKIPAMLAAADALILATWLPNAGAATPMGDEAGFALTQANVEHIAATSAAIQNLLLAATARGISNYWSSGGVLRLPSTFQLLGIPTNQILLGAIFLFPREFGDAELATSKLRDRRTPVECWTRWV
ncbi:MAG: nitroreductase family protein [Pirellulaceae bacterium]|nr:nitroreductase family protein [Pirellulaceae bacterium]